MTSKHTPGPWKVRKWSVDMHINGSTHQVTDNGEYPTAFVPGWDRPKPGEVGAAEEAKANARLIAMAPRMYEVLSKTSASILGFDSERLPQVLEEIEAILNELEQNQ